MTNMLKAIARFIPYGKEDPRKIRDIGITALYEAIEDYSEWYDEHGIHLPPTYADNPTAYTEDLHKMSRAFRLLYEEIQGEGELWEAKHGWEKYGEKDVQKIEELEKDIQEGLLLFGQNFFYMTDPKNGTIRGK
jgi:hypothetical protein